MYVCISIYIFLSHSFAPFEILLLGNKPIPLSDHNKYSLVALGWIMK